MADEQYRWLDRETAERLLSGEPLDAVDAADRDQAERLAKTLEALADAPPPTSAELPGEAAALAAFRAARAERADTSASHGHRPRPHASDAGLVRIGAPERGTRPSRWARPVRLGLAAALAVGMVGGVAVAAGTGVLPTPFDGDEPVAPAASVSAAVPAPEQPLVSPSAKESLESETVPDGASAPPERPDPSRQSPDPGATAGDAEDHAGGWWKGTTGSACRELREGRRLSDDARKALEGAAGGPKRVATYCQGLLADGMGAGDGDDEAEKGDDGIKGNGKGDDEDDEDGDGRDHGRGDGHGHGRPERRTDGAAPVTPPVSPAPADPAAPAASPAPTYSAL